MIRDLSWDQFVRAANNQGFEPTTLGLASTAESLGRSNVRRAFYGYVGKVSSGGTHKIHHRESLARAMRERAKDRKRGLA